MTVMTLKSLCDYLKTTYSEEMHQLAKDIFGTVNEKLIDMGITDSAKIRLIMDFISMDAAETFKFHLVCGELDLWEKILCKEIKDDKPTEILETPKDSVSP